jgi:hypothetical protein
MLANSLKTKFQSISPPRPAVSTNLPVAQPVDTFAAREKLPQDTLKQTLKAMAGLAIALGPQAAPAAGAETVATEVLSEQTAEESTLRDRLDERVDGIKEKAEDLKEKLDPNGYLDDYETKIGDYDLRVRPLDLSLRPRFKDGKPALKFKGEILETSLSKSTKLEGGWTMRQGLNAKLQGEVTTYDDPEIDLQAGVFREYRGTVGEDFQARFQGDFGVRHRFLGEEAGMKVGFGFRQELEGGNYQFMGHDYQLYAEGRQGIYQNFDTNETELSYSFMAGPKKDFDLKLFGKEGKLTITVGPEVRGNQDEAFNLGLKSKVRLRF